MLVKFPYSASRRLVARRPRRSKNGTPEERAAKAASRPTIDGPRIPRRSKNGTPEERAAKKAPAAVLDATLRLASRAETARRQAEANRQFAAAYVAATLAQREIMAEEQNGLPNLPA
jgi:hypothetical protein